MEKRKIIIIAISSICVFLWLFFIGQLNGATALKGDLNLLDEGQYAAWVNHMLHGKMIYRDFFPPYGPLQVYPLYLLMKYFGSSFYFARTYLSVIGVFLGICCVAYALIRLNVKPLIGGLSFIFIIIYPGAYIRMWVGIFTLLFYHHSLNTKSSKGLFLSGILLAISIFQSIEVGVFSFVLVVVYAIFRYLFSKNKRNELRLFGVFTVGFLLSIFLFAVWALKEGWLIYYIKETFNYLASVSGNNLPNGQGLPDLYKLFTSDSFIGFLRILFSKGMLFYWSLLAFILFEVILILRVILRKIKRQDIVVFLIVSFSLLTYFSIIGRSGHNLLYAHLVVICASYFLSLIPPIKKLDKPSRFVAVLLYALIFLYTIRFIAIYRYFQISIYAVNTINNVPRVAPLPISKKQADDIIKLQKYTDNNSNKTDPIFVMNNIPALYFLLDRANSTKYDFPLLAITKIDRNYLIKQLMENPPIFIIEDTKAWAVDDVTDKQRLPEVYDYILNNYRLETKINHYNIYKHRLL